MRVYRYGDDQIHVYWQNPGGERWVLEANAGRGRVAFRIHTKGLPKGSGARAFDAMLQAFAGHDLHTIIGHWERSPSEGDNFDGFQARRAEGYSPAGAAALTFTGIMAGRHGFHHPEVRILRPDFVYVYFTKGVDLASRGMREDPWAARQGERGWYEAFDLDFVDGAGI